MSSRRSVLWDLADGIVGLGIENIYFSPLLSVRWGMRVESYFRGETCDLLHCPLMDLSFRVGDWIRRFEDNANFILCL